MTMDERYQRLEDTVRAYNPTASFDKIRAAYEFAAAALAAFGTGLLAAGQRLTCKAKRS